MINTNSAKHIVVTLFGLLLITACVQLPTEKSQSSDLRPGIAFRTSSAQQSVVLVDGQKVGLVGDFPVGEKWLKLITGTHRIQVLDGDRMLIDEKVYLGDSNNRSFTVDL